MNKTISVTVFLATALLLNHSAMSGSRDNPIWDGGDKGNAADLANPYVEGKPWEEIKVKLPPFPKNGDLMDLNLDSPGKRFTYYIDEESLTVSDEDRVIRYTMVIESNRGTRNIFYEGIRCDTMEYKTYAFGSSKGQKLRASKKPKWKSISSSGYKQLRTELMEQYFCEWKIPRNRSAIVNKIKYAAPTYHADS